ncbi:sugar ABC transporter permease (plasmid) [Embleya sp. NBC_00888]|uniref:carbohydrate ABC transporter permease n=1 Tax=Embleya sp. NBC_00888 TaxID=2975960 RepID=UPI002F908810|nr:sugar ABC transporter permease [Embleya sp. NBC_00888]
MRKKTFTRAGGLVWVVPALLLVSVFIYYPIVETVRLSFFHWNAFSPTPRFVGLDNYREAADDPIFWRALRNNVGYAVVSVICQVGLSLALAATLEELVGRRLRSALRTVYFIPAAVSITVAGMLFRFLYDPNIGLVNRFLDTIGLGSLQHAWLGESATAIWAIIAMSQWQSMGYTAVLFMVAIQKIPRELYEAAQVDGAGRIRSFFTITVPMVREMTTLMVILTVSGAFLVFNEVMVTTGGGPNNSSQVLGTWLYRSAFLNDDMGYASAIATVILLITVLAAAAQLLYAKHRRVES